MPLGSRREGAAEIPKTRRIELDGIELKLSPEELEKGVAVLTFLPKTIKTTAKRGAPRFHITDVTLARVHANMTATENDLPVLYAHGKSPAHGPIAGGWISKKILEKNRVAVEVNFTERALEHIRKRELRYLSPGLDVEELPDGSFEPYDGYELSLTNTPLIDGQQRLAADREGGTIMDLKKFAKLAGLAEDATEEQVLEAITKKLTPDRKPDPSGSFSDDQVTLLADRIGSRFGLDKLAEMITKQAGDLVAADRKVARVEALLERAMKEGKAVAADRKVTVGGKEKDPLRIQCEADPDAFEAWLKVAPRKAPVAGTFPKGDNQDAISGDEQLPGAFAKADFSDPAVRGRLHRAALARVEAKKDTDYNAATITLTRAN